MILISEKNPTELEPLFGCWNSVSMVIDGHYYPRGTLLVAHMSWTRPGPTFVTVRYHRPDKNSIGRALDERVAFLILENWKNKKGSPQ